MTLFMGLIRVVVMQRGSANFQYVSSFSLCLPVMLLHHAASEPNLLKVRLKQRVMNNHRNSPMARHKDRHFSTLKRKSQLASTRCIIFGGGVDPL
jgi:hypothetical protein